MSGPIVQIPQGKLQGKKDKSDLGQDYYCFHRIPYAKPPVGELRFKAPQPADGWAGIRDATCEGTICPSPDFDKTTYRPNSDEDSLFINVYCKQNPENLGGKKYPVMVWIHGGGFEFGSGNKDMNNPAYFMQYDIILVTFNYRVGVLGFLSLQTIECPGNFGLKDQQLAMRWVKNNIAYFGGDAENVTLFGVSAGGASVQYQTLAGSNKGLFKRAIIQSGSVLNSWAYQRRPRENAFMLGKRLGCDTKDDKVLLEFLKKAKPEDLVMKSIGIINDTEVKGTALGEHFLNFTFVPTTEPEHEGAFAAKHPWMLLKEKGLDIPVITGICSKEMILGVKNKEDYPRYSKVGEFQELFPRELQLEKNSEQALSAAKKIKDFYFKNGVTLDNYIDLLSDTFFNFGVLKTVKNRVTNKNVKSPTYLYQFSYSGDQHFLKQMLGLADIKGTAHGEDSCYQFKTIFSGPETMAPGSRDFKVMQKFTKLWVNYATTGVPTLDEPAFQWKETSFENMEYLNLGEKFTMEKGLLKGNLELWDEIFTSYFERK